MDYAFIARTQGYQSPRQRFLIIRAVSLSECSHRALRVTVSWLMAADVISGSLLKTAAERTCDHN